MYMYMLYTIFNKCHLFRYSFYPFRIDFSIVMDHQDPGWLDSKIIYINISIYSIIDATAMAQLTLKDPHC